MMICRLLDYLALLYLAVTPPCAAGRLPPPRNLSYAWLDPFRVNLSWVADPRPPPGCSQLSYRLTAVPRTVVGDNDDRLVQGGAGGQLGSDRRFTLRTVRSGPCKQYDDSEEVSVVIPRQVPLVSDFQFFLYPACDRPDTELRFCGMQATWTPLNGTSRLQMSYRPCSPDPANLSACEVFDIGGRGQGCHLADLSMRDDACIKEKYSEYGDDSVLVPFNKECRYELQVQPLVMDICGDALADISKPLIYIRTLRPDVVVAEEGLYLRVTWRHATVCDQKSWRYRVNYSECSPPAKEKYSEYGDDSVLVPFNKECRYELQVQPLVMDICGDALADISKPLIYNDGASKDRSTVVLLVAVPAILSAVVLMLSCYVRRKMKAIFQNIPAPPSALKEMMSSIHQRQQQLVIPMPGKVNVCVVSPPEEEEEEEEVEEIHLLIISFSSSSEEGGGRRRMKTSRGSGRGCGQRGAWRGEWISLLHPPPSQMDVTACRGPRRGVRGDLVTSPRRAGDLVTSSRRAGDLVTSSRRAGDLVTSPRR
ncbi:hypothetical protein CRUP_027227 [Coryphaenoides rupestris]|nr:hypothetical protein CRUP_027227 [Coryphaenoides rupestris]